MVEWAALTFSGSGVRKRLFYFAQRAGEEPVQCPSAAAAERLAAALAAPAAAFMVEGDPEAGCWDEPEWLVRYEAAA